MNQYLLTRLGDQALERDMLALFAADCPRIALEIAHVAEFDARRLYAPQGFASTFEYLVSRARLSDDAALKRIRAARAARAHPELFEAMAQGRLHLTAVVLLGPKLRRDNVDELIAAATHKTVEEIRAYLAERFPRRDVPLSIRPEAEVVSKPVDGEVGSKPVGGAARPEVVLKPPAGEVPARAKVAPLGAGRYETRFTMGEAAREAIRYFEQLAGRKVTAQEMSEALREGFQRKSKALEQRRFGATDNPRKQKQSAHGRHIPNAIKREVWQRDEGRCTFVAENGRRCERRGDVEFDHIEPVAKGGKSTPENLRLLCRAHNQYEAERAFGAGFMHVTRERAKAAGEERKRRMPAARPAPAAPAAPAAPSTAPPSATPPNGRASAAKRSLPPAPRSAGRTRPERPAPDPGDVTPWLLRLGFGKQDAARAAAHCDAMPDASLEQRVKAALSFLAPPARVSGAQPRAAGPA